MRVYSVLVVCMCFCVLMLSAMVQPASAGSPEKNVSGSLTVDGKNVALVYAYVDETQPDEPIVVLSDKPLPADAIPFVPEKLVKEQKIHAIAFSVSRQDKKLTNTYGMLKYPGNASGVGLGRVEEGRMTLAIKKLDGSMLEGKIATTKPVKLSYISYSFDLSFKVGLGKKK
jgi:hypothetical protein